MYRSSFTALALVWLIMFLPLPSLVGETTVLDLETCLSMARGNNRDLKRASLGWATALREEKNTWSLLLPGISAGGGISESSPLSTGPWDPSVTRSASLNMSLSLNAGMAAEARGNSLSSDREELSYDSAEKSLLSGVEKEFYYLITSASNLEIVRANLELSWKNYDQTKSNYDNGMASELALLQARVTASNLEPKYKQAEAAHQARMNGFLLTIGLEPGTEVLLKGNLEREIWEGDGPSLADRYLADRPDVRALLKDLDILRNRRNQTALTNRTPTLGISSGWSASRRDGEEWSDRLTLALEVRVPLDDLLRGSSTSLALRALDDQIGEQQIGLDQAMAEARTEIINLVNQLNTAADNIRISSLNIDLAEESFLLTRESFSRGLSQPLEVDRAQQALLEARQQYLSSQYDYLSGLIDLRDALGRDSLEELNR